MINAPLSPGSNERAQADAIAEEHDLVRRMRDGDREAFEEFASHYVPGLYRFAAARLRGEQDLVKEVVQTTVCRFIEKLDSYRGEAALFTWLCTVARNEIASHFRRARKVVPVDFDVDEHIVVATAPALATVTNARRPIPSSDPSSSEGGSLRTPIQPP